MADFDLTQTDQQVQNILNDAQGAMGASAQTTLTTEYVMLKDTNGVYHKILKSSFTEAIRDVLAGLLVNNDKGTTISQIAAIASGDFGSITPANLASVLGVFRYIEGNVDNTHSVADLNNVVTTCIVKASPDTANIPVANTGYYVVLTFKTDAWYAQFAVAVAGSGLQRNVYLRTATNMSSSGWSVWKLISQETE